ncbi:MAG: hypothetical protein HPY75_12625 [Actinobacteria bacterium]|nr:hypothetical protein [Actinomycetota bacterium]
MRAENEAALRGGLGKIKDAAMSSGLGAFISSKSWFLEGLTEEERILIWRQLHQQLSSGYVEFVFDGSYLTATLWENGVPNIIYQEQAYSGQPGMYENMPSGEGGPIPHGIYLIGENLRPSMETYDDAPPDDPYGDFNFVLEEVGSTKNRVTGWDRIPKSFAIHEDHNYREPRGR